MTHLDVTSQCITCSISNSIALLTTGCRPSYTSLTCHHSLPGLLVAHLGRCKHGAKHTDTQVCNDRGVTASLNQIIVIRATTRPPSSIDIMMTIWWHTDTGRRTGLMTSLTCECARDHQQTDEYDDVTRAHSDDVNNSGSLSSNRHWQTTPHYITVLWAAAAVNTETHRHIDSKTETERGRERERRTDAVVCSGVSV